MTAAVATFPCRPRMPATTYDVDRGAEELWRAACHDFLRACFRGGGYQRIKTLGHAVMEARATLERMS